MNIFAKDKTLIMFESSNLSLNDNRKIHMKNIKPNFITRKLIKRNFKIEWITTINSHLKYLIPLLYYNSKSEKLINYNQFKFFIRKSHILLNNKMLAQLIHFHPFLFNAIIKIFLKSY